MTLGTTMVERRLWSCPGCGRRYQIPQSAPDPDVCPECRPVDAAEIETPPGGRSNEYEDQPHLRECPACGRMIGKHARECPVCGEAAPTHAALKGILASVAIVLALGLIIALGKPADDKRDAKSESSAFTEQAYTPKAPRYTILNESSIPGIKRQLKVLLPEKVSRDELAQIAIELKNVDSGSYPRTFITYVLPNWNDSAGAWATTHFNPNLEIHIQGLTQEAEQQFQNVEDAPARDVIGVWIDERPFLGSRVCIFRRDGSLCMESRFRDGSRNEEEIAEKPCSRGRRFEKVRGSFSGDHWIINANGDLEVHDVDGHIATHRKVRQ